PRLADDRCRRVHDRHRDRPGGEHVRVLVLRPGAPSAHHEHQHHDVVVHDDRHDEQHHHVHGGPDHLVDLHDRADDDVVVDVVVHVVVDVHRTVDVVHVHHRPDHDLHQRRSDHVVHLDLRAHDHLDLRRDHVVHVHHRRRDDVHVE